MTAHHAIRPDTSLSDWQFIERVRRASPEAAEPAGRFIDLLNAICDTTGGMNFSDDALPEMTQQFADAAADFAALVEEHIHEASRRNPYDGRE